MQFPGRLGFCSTTVAIKVLFLLVSLLLLVLFLQNMFYAVYAKFNLHEIRLVHQQSSWNEKPAKMVELHQMTSNLNESQRLRRITLQLSFTHYIFLPSNIVSQNRFKYKVLTQTKDYHSMKPYTPQVLNQQELKSPTLGPTTQIFQKLIFTNMKTALQ